MANRFVFALCGVLATFSGLASEYFPNTNTVPMVNGQRAALIAVRQIDYPARTAYIILDARDKFGTLTRINAPATINSSKLKTYVKQCLNAKLACAAALLMTELLIQYGATIQPDGTVTLPGAVGGSYPNCVSKPVPWNGEGGVVTAWGPIPCAVKHPNGNADFYSYEPTPQKPIDTPQKMYGYVYDTGLATQKVYYRNPYFASRPEPLPTPKPQELTDPQLEEAILKQPKPEVLQIQPGKYPDIFNPIPVPDAAKDSDIGTTPKDPNDPTNPTDPESEPPAEMIDLSQIPTLNIDVSKYLTTGSGWLPKECPPPVSIPIFSRTLSWEYNLMCDVTNRYVSAVVMLGAVFFFLRIVVGGLDRG